MNKLEARQRLHEFAHHERRIQRRFLAPTMLFWALFSFVYLLTSDFGIWWAFAALLALTVGWGAYSVKLGGVAWSRGQQIKLCLTLFLTFYWAIICKSYFVNWNPLDLSLSPLLGAVLAAVPFLVLSKVYRP